MLAALASATMPNVAVVGVRDSEQKNETDQAASIDQAVVQDVHGNFYNVYATNMPQGKKRLAGRVRAARVVDQSRELAGLGFSTDHVVAFDPANNDPDETAVLVTTHPDGVARSLDLLTLGDCASIGTAIGAIHRLRPSFLVNAKYPAFTTGQIHAQLTAWIRRLRQAGHVPQEITDSWAHILETEGLWSFATCPVHGGFSDGDFIFSGSTITTITNWQEMQINDPARDLAWIFSKLDETHRNAVISAYGRILGNRLDDLIMLRANLWVQMDQVGDFIQALNQGDNARIMQFKAQVDRLAHQLGTTMHRRRDGASEGGTGKPPSTVTVNTLLREDQQRRDTTNEHAVHAVTDDRTNSHSIDAIGVVDADDTASRQYAASAASSETMVIGIDERTDTDATGEAAVSLTSTPSTDTQAAQLGPADAKTMLIPLLEREERAMRDARAGLNGTHPHTSSSEIAATPDDVTQS